MKIKQIKVCYCVHVSLHTCHDATTSPLLGVKRLTPLTTTLGGLGTIVIEEEEEVVEMGERQEEGEEATNTVVVGQSQVVAATREAGHDTEGLLEETELEGRGIELEEGGVVDDVGGVVDDEGGVVDEEMGVVDEEGGTSVREREGECVYMLSISILNNNSQ